MGGKIINTARCEEKIRTWPEMCDGRSKWASVCRFTCNKCSPGLAEYPAECKDVYDTERCEQKKSTWQGMCNNPTGAWRRNCKQTCGDCETPVPETPVPETPVPTPAPPPAQCWKRFGNNDCNKRINYPRRSAGTPGYEPLGAQWYSYPIGTNEERCHQLAKASINQYCGVQVWGGGVAQSYWGPIPDDAGPKWAHDRAQCGKDITGEDSCLNQGCLWGELHHGSQEPWCYHKFSSKCAVNKNVRQDAGVHLSNWRDEGQSPPGHAHGLHDRMRHPLTALQQVS